VAIGEKMGLAAKESMKVENVKPIQEVYSFINVASAEKAIMEILKDGDTVLVKGSRAMSMEKIVEDIVDAV
jgi:UDP-N-acetylmuramyl pentapeptide synthase